MKSFLFLVILFVTLPVYAIYDESSIHHKLEEIGIALNHQDFITAKVLRDELLQSASIEEIAKNATYIDYLSFIQELVWEGRDEKFESALILREKYHPEDTERASFLTRKNAEWYT